MKYRNTFLEKGGLFWESETHEWFNDKTSTDYANKKSFITEIMEEDAKDGLYDTVNDTVIMKML